MCIDGSDNLATGGGGHSFVNINPDALAEVKVLTSNYSAEFGQSAGAVMNMALKSGTRRIVHHNVTAHPTADWTVQQFREALPGCHSYRFLIHDRDSIFCKELDKEVTAMGVRVVRTPVRAPKANSLCERF
ncbi:MAG: hypothetical protein ACRD7E_16315, partial [Bryobacteraceae bacterium]